MLDFSHQCVLITGGSRGIGAATALLFAKAGANVAIMYSNDKKSADKVIGQIRSLGAGCYGVRGCVENASDSKRVVGEVIKKFGRIDILVNSAGIWGKGRIGSFPDREWEKTIAVNLTGTFNMCNAVVPVMKRQKYGRIVNVSSTAAQRGEADHSHYAASKGGINAFTKSIAVELIRYGIWVNCVAPGWVDTDMVSHVFKSPVNKKEIFGTIPRGRIGKPEEIAGPILFLASHLADNLVGEILNVNGGSVLCG
jgi:3-oxoacyl-[acyl-carrier protein] reductase